MESRFAHTEGKCCLVYVSGGEVITAGADGEVRVFKGFQDDDPSSHLVGDAVFCLAAAGSKFFVGTTESNKVESYTISDGASEGTSMRFAADASCLDVSADGKLLVAGSFDMTVKLVQTDSFEETVFSGHAAPILSVALDAKKEFVISSSCDGSVRVWSVKDHGVVKTFERVIPKKNDIPAKETYGKVAWSPSSKFFALGLTDGIQIYERGTWIERQKLKIPPEISDNSKISSLCWSPDGQHVVGGSSEGQLIFWDLACNSTEGVIKKQKSERSYALTDVAWNPSDDEVAFVDDHGYWGVAKITSKQKDLAEAVTTTEKPDILKKDDDQLNEEELAAALFEDEDDEDENSFSIRKIKRETGFLSDHDDASNLSSKENRPSDTAPPAPDGDTPAVKMPTPLPQPPPALEIDIQEPFQPGSTPSHLSSHFMVWNSVGLVRCISSADESAIEVEFHDSSVHHPLHISNVHGHTMADLSAETLVLACEAGGDEDDDNALNPSRLVVHCLSVSDAGREWSVEMLGKEEVMAVACGLGWVAAATDRRRLRIFTSGGLQKEILSLPGPAVALAGKGSKLLVSVHLGMPLVGNQNIGFTVLDITSSSLKSDVVIPFQPVSLAPKSVLSWLGFSDEGCPALADSSGQVRLYKHSWLEVCDTRLLIKGRSDHHFVVGLSESEQVVRSILCKGSRYPMTLPKPMMGVLRMALPVCEIATEKSLLEEELVRSNIFGGDDQAALLMKLFALACKGSQDGRALDVCKLMDTNTIQVALKYSSRIGRMHLANKLSELACAIKDKEDEKRQLQERCQSVDIFDDDSQQTCEMEEEEEVNPFLAAKKKMAEKNTKSKYLSPSQNATRNPFKKSSLDSSSGAIRSGIVFDDMTASTSQSRVKTKEFGAKRVDPGPQKSIAPQKSKLIFKKSTPASPFDGKENSADAGERKLLKGFQLWLAENREAVIQKNQDPCGTNLDDSEVNSKGLQMWTKLSKDEKESYKSPRVPKRKREDDGVPEESSSKGLKL